MTREQRLLKKVNEIEELLQELSDEMKKMSKSNIRKSDSGYHRWVHDKFFVDDGSFFNAVERNNIECVNMLKQAVGCLTEKPENKVKVVMTLMGEWFSKDVWIDRQGFELLQEKGEIGTCPKCHSWVRKDDVFTCTCGHHFETRKDIMELTIEDRTGERTERYIKTSPWTMEYELVIAGKTYPAEHRLVPKEPLNEETV